jgi:hypothetical protein
MERLQSDEQPLPRFKSCHLDHKNLDILGYSGFFDSQDLKLRQMGFGEEPRANPVTSTKKVRIPT